MKKLLVSMLLAVALVAPVFAADQGAMELDVKAGFNIMSNVNTDWDGAYTEDESIDPAFTAGVDFFYYVMPQLAIGAGIQYIFNSKIKDTEIKVGWTNLYAQAKYVFETGNDIFNNVYPLVQIGYGIFNIDWDYGDADSNGLYWGIGAGTTIKENFVFEILYSKNSANIKTVYGWKGDVDYSTLQLKVGYKFTF